MFEPDKIPGMIEPREQEMLTALAASPAVADSGLIVEFGTYFGRSTACLVNGAKSWWTSERPGPAVRAYDSFAGAENGGMAPFVWNHARSAGIESLVRREAGRIDFLPVYRHFLGAAEDLGLLKTTAAELRDTVHDGAPIGLMHVDAPKFYDEFKYVLFRFFPSLAPGGYVVFQDYFFQWSATLIAAAELLAQAGVLEFERSAASSMVAKVLRAPSAAELAEIDLAMISRPLEGLLDDAIARAPNLQLDRSDEFVPRLHLAKMQYLWGAGDPARAEAAFGGMLQASGGRLHINTFGDLRNLLRFGFDLRKVYQQDH